MKAMLFAAGEGRRLRPLTLERPKPLLEVAGKALIVYHLEALYSAGIREVVVNVSYLGEQIIAALGDGARWGLRIDYSREAQPLETAGGIVHAAALLGEAPFLMVSADVWSEIDYRSLVNRSLQPQELGRLVLVDNPHHHPNGDFSMSSTGELHHAKGTGSRYTYSGIGLLRCEAVLNCVSRRPRFPLREVFNELIARRQLFAQHHSGSWTDVGTPQRLQALNEALEKS